MNDATHPFEQAGLGKAPFRYIGIEHQEIAHDERVLGSVGGCLLTTKPGGTCAYCGQYILNMFNVESADGQRFHVGCDCIMKVDTKLGKLVEKDAKALKKHRESERIATARVNLEKAVVFRDSPHPNPWHASQGKTLYDYLQWMLLHGGHTSQLQIARRIEKILAPITQES